jgi:tRNA-specific 2-thiouridylase
MVIAMSGGVDSSVTAALCKQQGFDCIGIFMKNWSDPFSATGAGCQWEEDQWDVRQVCKMLHIPFYTISGEEAYQDRVFKFFLKEYRAGRTPNPDVLCNKEIKFRLLLDKARALGADALATGHYARVRKTGNGFQLLRGVDPSKDQSYFLHLLDQEQLALTRFPIGAYTKPRVRALAKQFHLPTAEKKDSQGICFIGEVPMRKFLQQYLAPRPGKIVTVEGEAIGTHEGVMYYTIGQRKGLNVGGGIPYYVADKDVKKKTLIVAKGAHHPSLYQKMLRADAVHWISGRASRLPFDCTTKIRYRQEDQSCRVEKDQRGIRVTFALPQRAITPGQSVVFYEGMTCLGGGTIQ